jgi:hypothetical protein
MLVADEQSVCELSPHGADEPLGGAVGSWTSRWDLYDVDAGVSENGIERRRELARPVTNQESKVVRPIVKRHKEVASLLSGPRPVWVRGGPEDMDVAGADFHHEEHVHRFNVTAQSTWKKSHASMLAA